MLLNITKLLLYIGYCTIGAVVITLVINPKHYASGTIKSVLGEYKNLYCTRDTRHPIEYQIGGAAAVSRIIVHSNLGVYAIAEYAKCKLTK